MSFSKSVVILALMVISAVVLYGLLGPQMEQLRAAPEWLVDSVSANDECTVLGEYCLRVRCAVTNAGNAQGVVRLSADLIGGESVIATRWTTRVLEPKAQTEVVLDFPEATINGKHRYRSRCER